jgi:serine O-acetyltransferase
MAEPTLPPRSAPAEPGIISATEPDWSREALEPGEWHPGKRLLRTMRRYQAWKARGGPLGWVACKWYVLRWRKWSAVSGAEIPLNARIGGGLALPHPNGVVVHPAAELGVNCMLMHQVTVGAGADGRVPRLGGHVDVGAGAKILGGVTIGDHAKSGRTPWCCATCRRERRRWGCRRGCCRRRRGPPRIRHSKAGREVR